MSAEKIISSWKQKKFKPLYWLQGEEDYYIDLLVNYAEHNILSPEEANFNLTVFYGRDAEWATVLNACQRYPMFAEKQVVLIKEAQFLKDIDKLESYFASPLASTILIVAYKAKGLDKRWKSSKTILEKSEVFTSEKIKENKIQGWIAEFVVSRGFVISPKAIALLEEHIGNDLSRIANEVDKLSLNLGSNKNIGEDDIERFIGISKEYNVFELQDAVIKKDLTKALRIIQYFEQNPKAVAIQFALPTLYSFASKSYAAFGLSDQSDAGLQSVFGYPMAVKQGRLMMKNYGFAGVERIILLLQHYNLRSIGVGNSSTSGPLLMKEMVAKMMLA